MSSWRVTPHIYYVADNSLHIRKMLRPHNCNPDHSFHASTVSIFPSTRPPLINRSFAFSRLLASCHSSNPHAQNAHATLSRACVTKPHFYLSKYHNIRDNQLVSNFYRGDATFSLIDPAVMSECHHLSCFPRNPFCFILIGCHVNQLDFLLPTARFFFSGVCVFLSDRGLPASCECQMILKQPLKIRFWLFPPFSSLTASVCPSPSLHSLPGSKRFFLCVVRITCQGSLWSVIRVEKFTELQVTP